MGVLMQLLSVLFAVLVLVLILVAAASLLLLLVALIVWAVASFAFVRCWRLSCLLVVVEAVAVSMLVVVLCLVVDVTLLMASFKPEAAATEMMVTPICYCCFHHYQYNSC